MSPFKSLRRDEKLIYKDDGNQGNGSCDPAAVRAVNLKTGASIITLDISPDATRSSQQNQLKGKRARPNSKGRPPSGSKSQGQVNSASRSRSSSTNSKQDDWLLGDTNPLSITPIVTPRERSLEPESDGDVSPMRSDLESESMTAHVQSDPEVFKDLARLTQSVGRFNKVAYPDLYGHEPPPFKEPQYEKKTGVQRYLSLCYSTNGHACRGKMHVITSFLPHSKREKGCL